jgi:hypothetical protein
VLLWKSSLRVSFLLLVCFFVLKQNSAHVFTRSKQDGREVKKIGPDCDPLAMVLEGHANAWCFG